MKRMIAICLLLAVMGCAVSAMAGACGNFGYAELQDMDQVSFLKEYCKVWDTAPTYIKVYMYAPRRDKSLYKDDADSCSDILGLMERVYMKRFGVDSKESMRAECKK